MRRPGFTIVDMVIALAVLAVVMTAVYSVFAFQQKTVRDASEGREVYGQALVILDRISRDLGHAWLPAASGGTNHVFSFTGRPDGFDLITTAALSPDYQFGQELVEVGCRVEEREDGERDLDGVEAKVLVRRQDDTLDDDPAEGGFDIVLTEDLASIELTYIGRDGSSATDWTASTSGELPAAVRIRLVLYGQGGAEEPFETVTAPALALPMVLNVEKPKGFEVPF